MDLNLFFRRKYIARARIAVIGVALSVLVLLRGHVEKASARHLAVSAAWKVFWLFTVFFMLGLGYPETLGLAVLGGSARSRERSVTLLVKIVSGVDKPINMFLTLDNKSKPTPFILNYLTWKSPYVTVPPHATVNNNITITASKDAPLGDFSLFLDGGHPFTGHQINLRITKIVDVPEFPSWAVPSILMITMLVTLVFIKRKMRKTQ